MFYRVWTLVRGLLQRRSVARELDDELRFHVEMETRSNINAGMRPAEARRVALRDFGGVEQTKEAVHDVRTIWLDCLWQDLRFALRMLRRNPGLAAVSFLSLAIGIGFNTALFTLVDSLLFRPLPVERVDQLVDVFTSLSDGSPYGTSSYPDFLDFKSQNDVFSDMLGYSPSIDAITLTDRSRLAMGEVVTGNYFRLLGVKPAIGRLLVPEDDNPGAPRVVVISNALWNHQFNRSISVTVGPCRSGRKMLLRL